MEIKGIFQFKIIINVLDSSSCFTWIPMLWVYGHYKYVNSFSAGTVLIRQNLGGGPTQQTRHIDQMLDQCWPIVYDVGPTLVKHWIYVSCLLGRVVVSTAAFHARVWGSVPGLGGLKETKMFLPHPRVKVSIVGSLRDREVAYSASDRQGSNFESCVWRTVSSQSSHHPQEVLLAQFSLYVHKGGLKPDSFHLRQNLTSTDVRFWRIKTPCCKD